MALLTLLPSITSAGALDKFKDPEDGKFDLSDYLLKRKGALPIPIIITEPAVGYGGGLLLAFFQQSLEDVAAQEKEGNKRHPPNVYAAGGFGTENGSWGALGGGMHTFGTDNRWRWRGGAGYFGLNINFYGVSGELGENGLQYNLKGLGLVNHLLYRLGDTDAWIVARQVYLDMDSRFDSENIPEAMPITESHRSSALGPSFEVDSRDNIFTPNHGWTGSLDALFYAPAFGSQETFQTYRGHVFAYSPLFGDRFVLGTRIDARTAQGDAPFYMRPYIDIRGITAARYQDENTAVLEEELRWNVSKRWALIGFTGIGRAWGLQENFDEAENRIAGGGGFRYKLARRLGMYSGIDAGWGPGDDFAIYLQFGNAWY